jgi:hypothetical protein
VYVRPRPAGFSQLIAGHAKAKGYTIIIQVRVCLRIVIVDIIYHSYGKQMEKGR